MGMEKGEFLKLIKMVCRKLEKGKSPETIAEELDEEAELIDGICAAATKNGLNPVTVYDSLKTNIQ